MRGCPADNSDFFVPLHKDTEGVTASALVGPANQQPALLLTAYLAAAAGVVVEGSVKVEDLAPELLRDAVPVHPCLCIGRSRGLDKLPRGSFLSLARRG